MATNLCRQNFHPDCEAAINAQINMELCVSYCYQSMAFYFARDDIALQKLADFFHKMSTEEQEHARKLMSYQNKRGGRIVLQDIKKPDRDEWGSALDAMQAALVMEKNANQALLDMKKVADDHGDAQMGHFIQDEFLQAQIRSIKDFSEHISSLTRLGPGMGEYHFAKMTLDESSDRPMQDQIESA
ncbi:soma ferritin-like [Babylonia areolata]|uniref:soma ferritin-like n=1 Tax=Babylonia areolata TaxID=304850 RepID=UPI003FCF5B37